MEKKRTSFNLPVDLMKRLNRISREDLPNKSLLVEQLLEKWLEENKKETVS